MIQPVRILDARDPNNVALSGPFTSAVSPDLHVTGSISTGNRGESVLVTTNGWDASDVATRAHWETRP